MRLPNSAHLALLATTSTVLASSICSNNPSELVPDGCATYGSLERLNQKIRPLVHAITSGSNDYFSHYRLDLYGRTCPFWSDSNGMCANVACAVNTIDNEADIPAIWRAEELGKLAVPRKGRPVVGEECDESDYCVPEDESLGSSGDYVSLIDNPERFTGYAGAGSENVWKSIYSENCFSKPKTVSRAPGGGGGFGAAGGLTLNRPPPQEFEFDNECLEKRVFYRVISGMHSSISVHLCWDYLNQTTGTWGPNLDLFTNRFKGFPDRIQNIYFNYALLLRAVSKLRNYLPEYTFCSGSQLENDLIKSKVLDLASAIPADSSIFDESILFQEDAWELKEDFRNRFRNVSRVMDCVGCDKCRLWGRVQTQGYGTALKILFEMDEKKGVEGNPRLRRTELVALVNTLDRVSHSLSVLPRFQELWEERNRGAAGEGVLDNTPAAVETLAAVKGMSEEIGHNPAAAISSDNPIPAKDANNPISELFNTAINLASRYFRILTSEITFLRQPAPGHSEL